MRHPKWPERLADFIEARRDVPFEWAKNDCLMFAADAVVVMTGSDPAAAHRDQYADTKSAANRIAFAGGMRGLMSLPEKQIGMAQRGDVVLAEVDGRESFGVVVGGGYWCGPGENGLVFRPMDDVVSVMEV